MRSFAAESDNRNDRVGLKLIARTLYAIRGEYSSLILWVRNLLHSYVYIYIYMYIYLFTFSILQLLHKRGTPRWPVFHFVLPFYTIILFNFLILKYTSSVCKIHIYIYIYILIYPYLYCRSLCARDYRISALGSKFALRFRF